MTNTPRDFVSVPRDNDIARCADAIAVADGNDPSELAKTYNGRMRLSDYRRFARAALSTAPTPPVAGEDARTIVSGWMIRFRGRSQDDAAFYGVTDDQILGVAKRDHAIILETRDAALEIIKEVGWTEAEVIPVAALSAHPSTVTSREQSEAAEAAVNINAPDDWLMMSREVAAFGAGKLWAAKAIRALIAQPAAVEVKAVCSTYHSRAVGMACSNCGHRKEAHDRSATTPQPPTIDAEAVERGYQEAKSWNGDAPVSYGGIARILHAAFGKGA